MHIYRSKVVALRCVALRVDRICGAVLCSALLCACGKTEVGIAIAHSGTHSCTLHGPSNPECPATRGWKRLLALGI